MLRGVADANVLVSSAISPHGVPAQLLRAAATQQWRLVVSPVVLAEVEDVLGRPRLRRWVTHDEAARFLETLGALADVVPDAPEPWPAVARDPKDDYLVALARDAGVDALISGDRDLTELVDLVPPVRTPAQFLAIVNAGR